MKTLIYPALLVCAFLIISCKDTKSNSGMMSELFTSDSAAVMFYHTPDNPRFFNYTKVLDMEILQPVIKDANGRIIKSKEECATQGKVYFYRNKEEVYVIYFNDDSDCMSMSFIITGEKYFTQMSEKTKELLNVLRKEAKEPVTEN